MVRTRKDLRKGQNRTAVFIGRVKRCICILDMGFGKTVSALTIFSDLQDICKASRWLVVAPLRVARDTWPDEINDWEHVAHLKMLTAVGDAATRSKSLSSPCDLVTINIENIVWLENWLKENKKHIKVPFDGVIVDESSKFKDPSTVRWKALRRLSKKVEYFVLLTGTPAPEQLYNLQPQVQLIDGGKRLGESFEDFRHEHFIKRGQYDNCWDIRPGHEDIIMKKIADICIVADPDDYIELPEMIPEVVEVYLSEEDKAKYRQLEREYILKLGDNALIEAISASALNTKLLQLANGCIYENTEDGERIPHHVHDAKIKKLKEIVDEVGDVPIMVAYAFRSDVDRIKAAFPEAVLFDKTPGIKDRWNRREIPMLLVSPKSAAHGLNIQFGGNVLVWFGLTYSYEQWIQLIKRLWRSGQIAPRVIVKVLMAMGTLDEVAYASCTAKGVREGRFIAALRSYIKTRRDSYVG